MNPVVLLIPFYFLFPVLVIYLCYRFPLVNKIGAVILCYLAGMLVGNFLSLPPAVAGLQDTLSSAVVALALPLLLFSMDVRAWFRLAGKSTLCMLLATIAIIVVAFGGFLIIRDKAPYAWQLGGMAVGLYTGGTPNLAAIKTALHVDTDVYITMHTYDTVISLIYILFLCSVAQRLFGLILPRFESRGSAAVLEGNAEDEAIDSYRGIFSRKIWPPLLGAFAVAIVILGASMGLAELFPEDHRTAVTGYRLLLHPADQADQENLPGGDVPDLCFLPRGRFHGQPKRAFYPCELADLAFCHLLHFCFAVAARAVIQYF